MQKNGSPSKLLRLRVAKNVNFRYEKMPDFLLKMGVTAGHYSKKVIKAKDLFKQSFFNVNSFTIWLVNSLEIYIC